MECTKCHLVKELAKGKRWCKDCKNKYERERRAKQSETRKKEIREKEKERYNRLKKENENKEIIINPDEVRKCTVCKKNKKIKNFHVHNHRGEVRSMCKECTSLKRKEYYQNNREAIIKQTNNYKINKMKTDPLFKLERRLRCRIYCAFKSQDLKKTERTHKYIGCSSNFLKKWLVYQLYDGMTLENYGKFWHIDHVKPCSKFDLSNDKEVEECFNWKNLRPYLASKNLQKNNEVKQNELVFQELKVKCFLRNLNEIGLKSNLPK